MNNTGTNIAIIDSGINPEHSHVGAVEGGLGFALNHNGQVVETTDFGDEIGHGTAIAGVVRERASRSRLYAAKIFHRDLNAPASTLLAAMRWSIDKNMKIIHLSLGTEREEHRQSLRELCQRAYENGLVVVASARGPNDMIYPAAFDTVLGVYWNKECDEDSLVYHPDACIEFGAYGRPRPLPGLSQEMNFSGSSFAAAYVTARVARLLEEDPNGGPQWVREKLIESAILNRD